MVYTTLATSLCTLLSSRVRLCALPYWILVEGCLPWRALSLIDLRENSCCCLKLFPYSTVASQPLSSKLLSYTASLPRNIRWRAMIRLLGHYLGVGIQSICVLTGRAVSSLSASHPGAASHYID